MASSPLPFLFPPTTTSYRAGAIFKFEMCQSAARHPVHKRHEVLSRRLPKNGPLREILIKLFLRATPTHRRGSAACNKKENCSYLCQFLCLIFEKNLKYLLRQFLWVRMCQALFVSKSVLIKYIIFAMCYL